MKDVTQKKDVYWVQLSTSTNNGTLLLSEFLPSSNNPATLRRTILSAGTRPYIIAFSLSISTSSPKFSWKVRKCYHKVLLQSITYAAGYAVRIGIVTYISKLF